MGVDHVEIDRREGNGAETFVELHEVRGVTVQAGSWTKASS
jgi:hypothetical protein